MTSEDRRAQIDDLGRQLLEPPGRRARGARNARSARAKAARPAPPRVAFQGDHGAFSEESVLASFGGRTRVLPCASLEDLFALLGAGGRHLALGPAGDTLLRPVRPTPAP